MVIVVMVMSCCYGDVFFQLQSAPFSLEHPSQYFAESRAIRSGSASGPKQEPVGMEPVPSSGGMELEQDSLAMDVTADLSVQDMEEFDTF